MKILFNLLIKKLIFYLHIFLKLFITINKLEILNHYYLLMILKELDKVF